MTEFLLNDAERLWADEGIARLEAAIMRSVAKGVEPEKAVRSHIDAMWDNHPHATALLAFRAVELGVPLGGRDSPVL
jgi:hypothetical protein